MDIDINQVKKVYFLGIGGIGVSALARMFFHDGKEVYGSDIGESIITKDLEGAGAYIYIGQSIDNIPSDTDLVVYSIAIAKFHPEFLEEVKSKVPRVISYPEFLSLISKNKYTIAVCGSHGKTTVTAMTAKLFVDQKKDPTVIVGSLLADIKTNFIAGKSEYFIVEACEYSRSFLNLNPKIILITSIDNDHLDYYKDLEDIKSAFKEFVAKLPQDGVVIGDMRDAHIKEIMETFSGTKIDASKFFDDTLNLKVPGAHNRRNASLVSALGEYMQMDKVEVEQSLISFSGTWRRFEYKGETAGGAFVYDDYAHHPTEIRATLLGAREKFPDKKITIVFEPHLFSRTKEHFADFVAELAKADYVYLLDIYPAREAFDPSISSLMLVDEIVKINPNTRYKKTYDDAKHDLEKETGNDDVILVMGAGDITKLSDMLVK